MFIPIIVVIETVRIIGIGMARKPGIASVYQDVLPAVDAMSNDIEPQVEREALAEAHKEATENPTTKEAAVKAVKESTRGSERASKIKVAKGKSKTEKKLIFYRKAFLTGYKSLLALCPQEAAIARMFGISEHAFANLRQNGDEGIKQAHKEVMRKLEHLLTASMLKQAIGYEYEEVKTTYEPKLIDDGVSLKKNLKPSKRLVRTKVEKTKKHYPGRPQLFLAYMATHFPEKWKLKPMADGGVHFHITGDIVANQINELAGKFLTEPAKVIDNEVIGNPDSE